MSEPLQRSDPMRFAGPGVLLALAAGYAAFLHHGLGPRPEVPDSALGWWSPRGFVTQALVGSSWEWLIDDRAKGMAVFGAPALLLFAAIWISTRSALARAAALTACLSSALFLFYALGSGATQMAWTFFRWRASGTMVAVAAVIGCAAASPWLAASWLRLAWPARIGWFLPILALVLVIERNVTGTNPVLPFAISPWPAVQVFGFEAIATTLAAELGGVALALAGVRLLRTGPRRILGAPLLLAGLALPAAWLALGSGGLLPFRVTEGRLIGAGVTCAVLLVIAALGARLEPARLRRRAGDTAAAAVLLGIPLFVGAAWARWDYSRTRDVYAQRIIDALHAYYDRESVYPDTLDQLVGAGLLDAVPKPQIGFPIAERGEGSFTYQGFGTSYLLEFSAPRWVQCAYNPPYLDEDQSGGDRAPDVAQGGSGAAEADAGGSVEEQMQGGSWSCPSKPPELW